MREQDIDRLPASEKLRCTVKERIHESQQPVPVVVGSRYKLRIVVRVDTERASDSRAVHALNRPAVHDGEARHCRSDSSDWPRICMLVCWTSKHTVMREAPSHLERKKCMQPKLIAIAVSFADEASRNGSFTTCNSTHGTSIVGNFVPNQASFDGRDALTKNACSATPARPPKRLPHAECASR
jgi:hypothetical protein